MASVTPKANTTIQELATKYTGAVGNAAKLLSLNNLKSSVVLAGQKITIPNDMLLQKWKDMLEAKKASSANMSRLAMLGAAAVGAYYFMKKKKGA